MGGWSHKEAVLLGSLLVNKLTKLGYKCRLCETFLEENIAGDDAKEKVEDAHDCTELRGVAVSDAWVMNTEDNDVEPHTQGVDCQAEEHGVFIICPTRL